MSSLLYPNGHALYRLTERATEPCWRIAYLGDLNSRLTDAEKAQYDGLVNSDFDNGLIHDESCHTCHGTGLQPTEIVVGYICQGCNLRGEHELFENTSCLAIGAGMFGEYRSEHEAGEHDGMSYTKCPLCAEQRMTSV